MNLLQNIGMEALVEVDLAIKPFIEETEDKNTRVLAFPKKGKKDE